MFEDSLGVENQNEDDQNSSDSNEKSSWWVGRWAHVPAMVVFCLLYFPFKDRFWSWQLAITLSYIVFMLCYTCGLAFKDADDFFGNLQVPRYMATLLIRQVFVIALISLGAYLWFRLKVILPEWATREAGRHKLSLWVTCGVTLACWAAVKEASFMAKKIKCHFRETED